MRTIEVNLDRGHCTLEYEIEGTVEECTIFYGRAWIDGELIQFSGSEEEEASDAILAVELQGA